MAVDQDVKIDDSKEQTTEPTARNFVTKITIPPLIKEVPSPKPSSLSSDHVLLKDLYPLSSIGKVEGRLPETKRMPESREHSPEIERISIKEKESKEDDRDNKKLKKFKDEKKKRRKLNKENSDEIDSEKKKEKKKRFKPFKIKNLTKSDGRDKKVYSPLSIRVTGLTSGTLTATSTPTTRSPAGLTPETISKGDNFQSSIEAVIARHCQDDNDENDFNRKRENGFDERPKEKSLFEIISNFIIKSFHLNLFSI